VNPNAQRAFFTNYGAPLAHSSSMNPAPLPENQDVNDLPISPSTPRPAIPDRRADTSKKSAEKLIDTDANPNARPPGPSDQDEDARDAKRHIDEEPGGPTPVIGN
jgi:hypothetical protein